MEEANWGCRTGNGVDQALHQHFSLTPKAQQPPLNQPIDLDSLPSPARPVPSSKLLVSSLSPSLPQLSPNVKLKPCTTFSGPPAFARELQGPLSLGTMDFSLLY